MVPTINQQKYPPKNTLDAQHSYLWAFIIQIGRE